MNNFGTGCAGIFLGGLVGAVIGPVGFLILSELEHHGSSSDGVGVAFTIAIGAPLGAILGACIEWSVAQNYKSENDKEQ